MSLTCPCSLRKVVAGLKNEVRAAGVNRRTAAGIQAQGVVEKVSLQEQVTCLQLQVAEGKEAAAEVQLQTGQARVHLESQAAILYEATAEATRQGRMARELRQALMESQAEVRGLPPSVQ